MTPAEIKAISQDTGLSWRELAAIAQVNESTVRKAAFGKQIPSGPLCMVLDMIHKGDLPSRFSQPVKGE